jgi:hypothetical protein
VSYADPFGLCPKDKGGDGKSDNLSDCPEGSEGYKEFRNPQLETPLFDPVAFVSGFVPGLFKGLLAKLGLGALEGLSSGAASAAAAKIAIPEGEALLVVVKDGKILKQTADIALSHARLVEQVFGTQALPEGAWVGTVGKHGGQIAALNSRTFFQNQGPASAAIQELIRSLFR